MTVCVLSASERTTSRCNACAAELYVRCLIQARGSHAAGRSQDVLGGCSQTSAFITQAGPVLPQVRISLLQIGQ